MNMKRIALLGGMLLALPAFAGAARGTGPHDALREFLRAPERAGAEVRFNARTDTPALLRAGNAPLAATGVNRHAHADAARTFLHEQAALFRLDNADRELALAGEQSDLLGGHRVRFQQRFNGVPVRGAQLLAHFNARGELHAVTAGTIPTPAHLDTQPQFGAADALYAARALFASTRVSHAAPQLEVHEIAGTLKLVWAIESFENNINRWRTIVDAHSGEVLRRFRDHPHAETIASGADLLSASHRFTAWAEDERFHLVDVTLPYDTNTENPLVRRSAHGDTYVVDFLNSEGDNSVVSYSRNRDYGWDPAGVSVLVNAQHAYRYFRDVHNHHGYDGNNGNLLLGIHYGVDYENAFWNGKWMVFGDGGKTFGNLAACADVVAHELSHGVIEHTAGLVYENQSGALNESFADLFGALAEGRDWTLGEDCTLAWPGYLRDMAEPQRGLRRQPAHMADYVTLANTEDGDWGGVHVNSGIPNRAAYLLIEGLSAEGLGQSIGRAKAEQLYFRALATYLTPTAQFVDLRRALLLAAADLFPADATVRAAVHAAFDAVGIVEATGSAGATDGFHATLQRLDFGDVAVGQRKTMTIALVNGSDATVTIRDVSVSGDGFAHSFATTRLAAGDSIEGTIAFTANASGTTAAVLAVHHDAASEPLVIDLVATGIELAPASSKDDDGSPNSASGGGEGLWLLALLVPAVFPGHRQGAGARSRHRPAATLQFAHTAVVLQAHRDRVRIRLAAHCIFATRLADADLQLHVARIDAVQPCAIRDLRRHERQAGGVRGVVVDQRDALAFVNLQQPARLLSDRAVVDAAHSRTHHARVDATLAACATVHEHRPAGLFMKAGRVVRVTHAGRRRHPAQHHLAVGRGQAQFVTGTPGVEDRLRPAPPGSDELRLRRGRGTCGDGKQTAEQHGFHAGHHPTGPAEAQAEEMLNV